MSKTKLRKITKEGPFDGKNKVFFDAAGKPVSAFEFHLKQFEQQPEEDLKIYDEAEVSLS